MHFKNLFTSSKYHTPAAHGRTQPNQARSATAVRAPTSNAAPPHQPKAWPMCAASRLSPEIAFKADGMPHFPHFQTAAPANVPQAQTLVAGLAGSMEMPPTLADWLKQHEALHAALVALGAIYGGRLILKAFTWVMKGKKAHSIFRANIGPNRAARLILEADVKTMKVVVYNKVRDDKSKKGTRVDVTGYILRAE